MATVLNTFQTGNHASRPTSGLAYGALYACSTHGLIYQTSDGGGTWVTWEDPGNDSALYKSGGTDVAVADGGTGSSTAAGAATNLGLGTGDSPQFTAIEVGHASDTTLARASAGNLTVEGNALYRAGGTDVALADGGTGASLTDPNADRIMFWDDSAGGVTWLTPGTGLTITTTTIDAAGGGGGWTSDVDEDGSSLTNWTQESGSWSVVSSSFQVTTPATTAQRLRLTAQKRQVGLVYQASVSMLSGGGFSGSRWCGLLYGWDGSSTGGTFVGLQSSGTPTSDGVVYVEQTQGIAAGGTVGNTFSFDTFYKLTVVTAVGGGLDFYVDGSYVGTWGGATSDANLNYIALLARNCAAQFKLIKSSYLSLPTLPL